MYVPRLGHWGSEIVLTVGFSVRGFFFTKENEGKYRNKVIYAVRVDVPHDDGSGGDGESEGVLGDGGVTSVIGDERDVADRAHPLFPPDADGVTLAAKVGG